MEPSKKFAITLLEALEFEVEEVPETDEERADLLVRDAQDSYIIETKDKNDIERPDWHEQDLQNGKVVHDAQQTTQNNTIDGVFKKARDQLNRTPADDSAFRIIWFQADGIDKRLIRDRALATFYGKVDVFPVGGNEATFQTCYYFDYATSYNIPTVDALILCDGRYLEMALNEFSENLAAFRATKLFSIFEKSVWDPEKLESDGDIIAFREKTPRKNDETILAELFKTTGTQYRAVRMVRYSASIRVPETNGKNGE